MFFSMTKVVLEVVALGLEDVKGLIFDTPSITAHPSNLVDIFCSHLVVCNKGVKIDSLSFSINNFHFKIGHLRALQISA